MLAPKQQYLAKTFTTFSSSYSFCVALKYIFSHQIHLPQTYIIDDFIQNKWQSLYQSYIIIASPRDTVAI